MTEHATMRDKAVTLARQGFRVFPLPAGKKSPPAVPWYCDEPPKGEYYEHIPATNPAEVHSMWSDRVGQAVAYNIGIDTADYLGLDVDNKDGKKGDASVAALAAEIGLDTATLEARTPTGGRHLYFRLPEGVRIAGKVQKLGEGLDTRGYHNYLVAPGSVVPGGEYTWIRPPTNGSAVADMAMAPAGLLERCKLAVERPKRAQEVADGVELDSPGNTARAIDYLANHAPEAFIGSQSDTVYNVALIVRDHGISEAACVELMLEHWNETKAQPPLETGDLEQRVYNAYAYAHDPIGSKSPEHAFNDQRVESEAKSSSTPPPEPPPTGPKLYWEGFSTSRKKMMGDGTSWLVKGYLGRNEMSVLYGDSNTGKTFVALDLAYHIAMGLDWNGHKVSGGLVVYVAAEAGTGIRGRLEALYRRYKPETEPPLVVVPCLVNLFSPGADLGRLLVMLEEISNAYGMPIAMVVLDTLARVIGPGDENSAQDMGKLVGSMDRIRVHTGGAHVKTVHHSGKNAANGARGSSALRAATDTELEIKAGKIIMRKQRNGELMKAVAFRLEPMVLGQDADGDSVTSCTVGIGAAVDFEQLLTTEQQGWLDELDAWLREKDPMLADINIALPFTLEDAMEVWPQPEDGDRVSSSRREKDKHRKMVKYRVEVLQNVGAIDNKGHISSTYRRILGDEI